MRTIFLLRGAPGSGKSTWVKENKLEAYTLCADNIRTMIQSPVLTLDATYQICQKNDRYVWELLLQILEKRMERGELLIIDATHYKRELLNRYVPFIDKYRYRAYVVDFTNISKEECLRRNKLRDAYKIVPEHVIEKMYSVFEASQNVQLKSCFHVVSKEEAVEKINEVNIFDFNEYENIAIFGDIHGSYSPIEEYFKRFPYNENWKYIFLGDYLDRNIENAKVLEFFIEFSKQKNVLCLEGNHEKWLKYYSSKDEEDYAKIRSSEFLNNTIPQIQNIDKPDIREFCRRLGQYALFKFSDYTYLVTHGGLPCLPTLKTSTDDIVYGVGKYEDAETMHKTFAKNYPHSDNIKQIHGHRNIFNSPFTSDMINYNLCSGVEYGADWRVIHLKRGSPKMEYVNIPVTIHSNRPQISHVVYTKTDNEIINQLNSNKDIIKKKLSDEIISYNFSRDIFYSGKWNELNCTARGLFIRNDKIIARSYDKFFNYRENKTTDIQNLNATLKYPVVAYLKENGFLGLVSYDHLTDKVFIASKSTNEGLYADIVREEFYKLENANLIIEWLKEHNNTLIFEVIDPVKDPHIIKYDHSKMILLDIVDNTFDTKYFSYDKLLDFAKQYKVECKFRWNTFHNFGEIMECIHEIDSDNSRQIEGLVFRDANNFQFKLKTPFYKKWKYYRSIKDKYCKGTLKQVFKDKEEIDFINWLKLQNKDELQKMDIITVRNKINLK